MEANEEHTNGDTQASAPSPSINACTPTKFHYGAVESDDPAAAISSLDGNITELSYDQSSVDNPSTPLLPQSPPTASTLLQILGDLLAGLLPMSRNAADVQRIAYVESKFTVLAGKYLTLKQTHHEVHADCVRLARENDTLKAHNTELLRVSHENKKAMEAITTERDTFQNEKHEALRAKQADAAEISKLRGEVRKYKQVVSSVTRVESQVADDEIRAMVDQLYNSLQDFSARTFRGMTFDLNKFPVDFPVLTAWDVPNAVALPSTLKPYALVSLLSSAMLPGYEPRYFFGLPELDTNDPIEEAGALAARFQDDVAFNKQGWLENTRKLLLANHPARVEAAELAFIEAMTSHFRQILTNTVPIKWKPSIQTNMEKIVRKMFDLFTALRRQKAVFRFEMMHVADWETTFMFQKKYMIAIGSHEEEEALEGRSLEMSIFPALLKYGNESGDEPDLMTVVSKGRVITKDNPLPTRNTSKR